MNILTLYISKEHQDYFEKVLTVFCKKMNNMFYYNDSYIDINECILSELDGDEMINIENYLDDFIAYSIIWKSLYSPYDLLNKINLDRIFLIDNDKGEIIKNDEFFSMSFYDFVKWAQ